MPTVLSPDSVAGDMRFVDTDKNGIINDRDRTIIGDPNPDIFGNFNFQLQWKGFTLSSMFTYVVGNDVYNALRANLESGSNAYNQAVAMANRWVANGQLTSIPAPPTATPWATPGSQTAGLRMAVI